MDSLLYEWFSNEIIGSIERDAIVPMNLKFEMMRDKICRRK